MPKMLLLLPAAALTAMALGGPAAAAESLRCRSINGNVNCVGSGGASCQTVDGRTVCMGGNGDAIQVFGNGMPSPDIPDLPEGAVEDDGAGEGEDDAASSAPPSSFLSMAPRLSIERRDADGGGLVLRREGRKLHVRTDRLSVRID